MMGQQRQAVISLGHDGGRVLFRESLDPSTRSLLPQELVDAAAITESGDLRWSLASWRRLGGPPELSAIADPDRHREAVEVWSCIQQWVAALLGLRQQRVSISVVGPLGGAAEFLVDVDGVRLESVEDAPTAVLPVVLEILGRAREPLPKGDAQYARWAEIRSVIDAARRLPGGLVEVQCEEHLEAARLVPIERFRVRWEENAPRTPRHDPTCRLLIEAHPAGEERWEPFEVADMSDEGLLPARDGARLWVRSAQLRDVLHRDLGPLCNVTIRRRLGTARENPAEIFPPGFDPDAAFDLEGYSERVLGFESPGPAPREFQPSGIQWVDPDDVAARPEPLDAGSDAPPAEADESQERAARVAAQGRGAVAIIAPVDRPEADADLGEAALARVPWDLLEALLMPGFVLKPHQKAGVAWFWRHVEDGTRGVLLADEMGLGKTLQALAFLALRRATRPSSETAPMLVVAPTILLPTWRDERARFFKQEVFPRTLILHEEKLRQLRRPDRSLDLDTLQEQSLIVTNYETLSAYQREGLLKVDFDVVVLDEAQSVKSATTARARAAQGLKRNFAIAMTGTPVENGLLDLWAIYEAAQDQEKSRAFGRARDFKHEFAAPTPEALDRLRTRLQVGTRRAVLLRREKKCVLPDLPTKRVRTYLDSMTAEQRRQEQEIAARLKRDRRAMLDVLERLKQLYQHPRLVDGTAHTRFVSTDVAALRAESPKLDRTVRILEEVRARNEKALIFTTVVQMQHLLRATLGRHFSLQQIDIINGDPANRTNAQSAIDRFSDSPGFDVLILSPLAAGLGLTITAANHVIHYGRWWNPAREDQATDRCHRIGQTKAVEVHIPILHHPGDPENGYDVKLHRLVERKRAAAREFLAPIPDMQDEFNEIFQ